MKLGNIPAVGLGEEACSVWSTGFYVPLWVGSAALVGWLSPGVL